MLVKRFMISISYMKKQYLPTDYRVCEFANHRRIIQPLAKYGPFEVSYDLPPQIIPYNRTGVFIDGKDAPVS